MPLRFPLSRLLRLVGLLAMACLALGAVQAEPEQVTLQLKWHHQFQFAGYYAAEDQGYYKEAGLQVNIREAEPGLDVTQEVTSGRAQYGVGTSALLLARYHGAPVVVLAAIFQHSPAVFLAKGGMGIATVHDLAGRRVMLEDGADELRAYLRKEGMSERSLVLVKHTFDPADLLKGQVACMSAYDTDEPYFLDQAGQDYLTFSPRMGGIDFYGDNLFTSEAELKAHPARVKAFREASLRGWKYAMAHPEEVADLIIRRYGPRRGKDYIRFEARRMVPLIQPNLVDIGYMYEGRWQHVADVYEDLGLLPDGYDFSAFVYDPEAAASRARQKRFILGFGAMAALGLALGGLALVFYRLNVRLRLEIASRLRAEEDMRQEHAKQRELQDQLQQSQKMQSLGSLAGGVAHDMNNVLGAILGMASSQLEQHPEGSPARRAFTTIIKAAERGGGMVRGLLDFARKSPAQARDFSLNVVMREEVLLLERTTLARVRLDLDLDPDLRTLRGDPGALSHAIMNLCVNAVDAMPEGGVLTLRTRNLEDGRVEAQVEDTGTGMPPEVLARALDPFFTTKAEGRGTGLGLSMVYSTVTAHQGELHLDSAPGRGTRVSLRFPALGTAPRREAGAEPWTAPPPVRPLRVLVADDDPLVRESIQSVLEVLGHRAEAFPTGEELLDRLADLPDVDLVILDLNMPGLGGPGTLPRLRALRPDLPVFLVTGRADGEAQALVDGYPGVILLGKPFSLKELDDRLIRTFA
ncbi:ABC transporter substrate-binding protein [Mesoterricola sediminis]|uniref:histidine kinase n=1 Tax=Mesoterricola sediminis TaxID=2927980 RepID=A0AA48KD86_9BACT|nr:ABC transporter substrate-binding protein [Mesoterricola sediminis]BDU76820.1 hypothetical protein METESE_17780 [Mesoterricola sediminis]